MAHIQHAKVRMLEVTCTVMSHAYTVGGAHSYGDHSIRAQRGGMQTEKRSSSAPPGL